MLMGTDTGHIYLLDPELVSNANVSHYNCSKAKNIKQKKVELIKWYEE